jgi:hypothetical protein
MTTFVVREQLFSHFKRQFNGQKESNESNRICQG